MTRDQVIATIQKLLNVTTDRGATEGEAANAAAAAQRLLLQYDLSLSEVQDAVAGEYIEVEQAVTSRTVPHWMNLLVGGLQRFFGVRMLHVVAPGQTESSAILFVGRELDVTLATWLFAKLKQDFYRSCLEQLGSLTYLCARERKRWRRSFFDGAALTVAIRMSHARRETVNATPGAGALVAKSDAAILQYLNNRFGDVGKVRTRRARVRSEAGFSAGVQVGEQVSLATNAIEPQPVEVPQLGYRE